MKTWKTAPRRLLCGYDPEHVITKGDAYLELETSKGKQLVRCSKCAVRHDTHAPEEPQRDRSVEPEPEPEPVQEFDGEPELEGDPW